jgi:surface antigen
MPSACRWIAAAAALSLLAAPNAVAAGAQGDLQIAHHKPGHQQGGGNAGGKKAGKSGNSRHGAKRGGGPPPWAPAHGYRGKTITYQSRDRGEVTLPESDLVVRASSGVERCNREAVGAVIGGVAGAAAGSQIGGGSGKKVATIAGAILGAMIGGSIGRSMDDADQGCIGQALERADTGATVVWRNPDNGGEYRVTPTGTYRTADDRYCREYTTTVVIGGRSERAYGEACREPDGTWRRQG